MKTLSVGTYNQESDCITIDGVNYSGAMFREFGFSSMVGQVLRIDKKEDGLVTVTRLTQFEDKL